MKKEEILEKARAEQSDEMEQHYNDKSMLWIIVVLIVCCIVFSFTRLVKGQSVWDYIATINLAISVGSFYRYSKVKSDRYLFQGIAFGIAGVIFVMLYFADYFGVRNGR